jgi:6-pyruvoyl-tetrahydropterin synthase
MLFSHAVTLPFEASHQADEPERCRLPHGHGWQITAVIATEMGPNRHGILADSEKLETALGEFVAEFNNRDLNAMLPSAVPATPIGLAAYALERLSLAFPRLSRVTVSEGPLVEAVVERDRY